MRGEDGAGAVRVAQHHPAVGERSLSPDGSPEISNDVSPDVSRALLHLVSLQRPDGAWEGEMVWCSMILSQYVIVRHMVGQPVAEKDHAGILHHYRVTRTQQGAWGLHPESPGYVFTTALAYVALRLLGLPPEHDLCAPARRFLRERKGGVLSIPTWGKLWLALCDLYGWEGINPFPPELFTLPEWLPIHPNHYYCHTRYIYLGIAYLYGRRFRADLGPSITAELRHELYGLPYEAIDFSQHRHDLSESDLFVRPGAALRAAYDAMAVYEKHPVAALRKRALATCLKRILFEQQASRYQGISPVNGLLNTLAIYSSSLDPGETGKPHPDLQPSLDGVESWRWQDAKEGIRYAGAHSTAWDTAFSMLATLAGPPAALSEGGAEALRRGYRFLRDTQMIEELPDHQKERRDSILGGWCFSDGRHRWAVSDCTAEALCAILSAHERPGLVPAADRIPDERIFQAAEFILRRQNRDGGFGTYEQRRGSSLLEAVNPSEMYGNCMTERSYIECTSSCLSGLSHLRLSYPAQAALPFGLRARIGDAIERAVRLLRKMQRPDGSYLGFWGINFTYAIFHVVKGLRNAGYPAKDPGLLRAAEWLVGKQREDGGWGEHYTSCLEDRYVEHPRSQVVMTSWALLALLSTLGPDAGPVRRGVAWLRAQQAADGSFPQGAVNGVFFGTAMLDYRLYKSYFPVWALSRYEALWAGSKYLKDVSLPG